MTEVPLTNDPAQRFEIELNGIRLFIVVRYNYMGGFWSFDLDDSDKRLVSGVTMITGRNLFAYHKDLYLTLGELWMYDTTGFGNNPTLENLGSEVILLHFLPGETVPLPEVYLGPEQ